MLGGDATERVLRDVLVTSNPTEAASARDVTVTPDGALFFVRRNDSNVIDAVSLDDGSKVSLTMPGAVTDLDLSPDGSSAFAVVRGRPALPPDGMGGTTGGPGAQSAGLPGGMGGEPGEAGGGGDPAGRVVRTGLDVEQGRSLGGERALQRLGAQPGGGGLETLGSARIRSTASAARARMASLCATE